MTRGTIPFAEEECGAGGYIARRRALDGGSRQGTNKSYQLLQLPFRKLKSGHASSRDTLADQFAQVIGRASAGAFRRDDVRSSLSALAIGAVTGGAARLEVTLTRLKRLWIADLSALCRRFIRGPFKPDQISGGATPQWSPRAMMIKSVEKLNIGLECIFQK